MKDAVTISADTVKAMISHEAASERSKLGWEHRQRDPQGYAVPLPGDKVHAWTAGLFGMPYKIEGEVTKTGKHVNITSGATNRKKVGLEQARWRVTGDPNIDKVADEHKKASDAEHSEKVRKEEEQKQWTATETERSVQEAISAGKHIEFKAEDLEAGQRVTLHMPPYDYGQKADLVEVVVNSPHDQWPDVRRVDAPDEPPWTYGNARVTGVPKANPDLGVDRFTIDPAYKKAHEDFKKVSQEHDEVTRKYRAREVGDKEFLASAERMKKAQADFDKAEQATMKSTDATPFHFIKAADGTLDFKGLADAVASVQVAHWAADTVTNAHAALGELYKEVAGLVDDLAEAYAGRTGKLPATYYAPEQSVDRVMEVVAQARAAVPGDAEDLRNILADMEAAANKAKYLLKAMDKSKENEVKADAKTGDNIVQCRVQNGAALPTGKLWSMGEAVSFAYCPGGVHTITAGFCGPVTKNRDCSLELTVDVHPERDAAVCQASYDSIKAQRPNQEPYCCFEHDEKQASVWATGFDYGPDPVLGVDAILLKGNPSGGGADAVNRRDWRSFSPSFGTDADYDSCRCKSCEENVADCGCAKPALYFPDGAVGSLGKPAKITGVAFVLGTLTNRPAFRAMPPVKAKKAGEENVVLAGTAAAKLGGTVKAHWTEEAREAALASRRAHAASAEAEVSTDFSLHRAATEAHNEAADMHEAAVKTAGIAGEKAHKMHAGIHRKLANHHADLAETYDHGAFTGVQATSSGASGAVKAAETTEQRSAAEGTVRATWSDAARQAAAIAKHEHATNMSKEADEASLFTEGKETNEAKSDAHFSAHKLHMKAAQAHFDSIEAGNKGQGHGDKAYEHHKKAGFHLEQGAKYGREAVWEKFNSAKATCGEPSSTVRATWSDAARKVSAAECDNSTPSILSRLTPAGSKSAGILAGLSGGRVKAKGGSAEVLARIAGGSGGASITHTMKATWSDAARKASAEKRKNSHLLSDMDDDERKSSEYIFSKGNDKEVEAHKEFLYQTGHTLKSHPFDKWKKMPKEHKYVVADK